MDSHDEKNDKQSEVKQDPTAVERSLSITRSEFAAYFCKLEDEHGEMSCPLCRNTQWGIPPRTDNADYAAIVTLPLPNISGRGIWAFPVFCSKCGFIAQFSTNHVSRIIREE